MIALAKKENKEEILALYKSMLYGPADWTDNYPNEDTIDFDLSREALYIMKNDADEIIAAISIDDDKAVEALTCWNTELIPGIELSRLCVRKDYQNQGISKMMLQHMFDILKERGNKCVHILVKTGHAAAITSYNHIGFKLVGECDLFGKSFVCMEKKL